MTGIADDPLRTLRLCDSALKSQHPDGIPRRICRAHRTSAEKSGILFGVAADGHCLFPAGVQVDRAARRVEASAGDQFIRHALALSGLRPAPPPSANWRAVSDTPRQSAADLPRQTVLNVLQNIKTTEYTEYTEGRCTTLGSPRHILQ